MLTLAPLLGLLALPLVSSLPVDTHPTFRLRPDPLAPAEIASLSYLPKSIYYDKNAPNAELLHAFYDTNTHTVNATDSSDILFLRPTHGTPMYFVRLGDPFADAVPALTRWSDWKIESKTRLEDGKEVTRDFLTGGTWMACPSGGEDEGSYSIYSGPPATWRCSELFDMEIVWDEKVPEEQTTSQVPTSTLVSTTSKANEDVVNTTITTSVPTTTTKKPVTITSGLPATNSTIPLVTGTASPRPSPTNGTVPIVKPSEPTEAPEYDAAAVPSANAGSLVVAIAFAVAVFGL
jgi:hypothetical protein